MTIKTIWLVDGSYLFKSASGRFDYLLLKEELERLSGDSFYESYYLNATGYPPSGGQDSFHSWLKLAPPHGPQMRVQLYDQKPFPVECPKCRNRFDRSVQKGVDVAIATLALKLAFKDRYDRLILSAGDGDFEDAVAYVKSELGKELWIAGFQNTISPDLQSYADRVIWLNEHWDQIKRGGPDQRQTDYREQHAEWDPDNRPEMPGPLESLEPEEDPT